MHLSRDLCQYQHASLPCYPLSRNSSKVVLWFSFPSTENAIPPPPPQANDAYLQMAIGNAPWPIGVTMVGIHARTGREKIFSKHVAHVLNDETQRKYIQVTPPFSLCARLSVSVWWGDISVVKSRQCS